MGKYAFYIGDFKAGIMDAQCQLVLGNCMILRELGYEVVLIGNDATLAENDVLKSKRIILGFDFYNIDFNRSVKGILEINQKHNEVKRILEVYPIPNLIIHYGTPGFAFELYKLYAWCKKHNTKLVSNCVDLSSQAHGNFLQRTLKKLDRRLRENIIYKKTDGIIAVSKYIKNYFQKYNKCPIIIIPPLKNMDLTPGPLYRRDIKISLVYIGVPFPTDGRKVDESAYKDRIDLFIDLLCKIRNKVTPFCFNIYGLTKEQYIHTVTRHKELLDKNADIVRFYGRIDHDKAMDVVRNADFSVVYRSKNQMTMAGFSSKLVESISCGTPVILTDTSDYMDYLKTGITCFLIDWENISKACEDLSLALSTSKEYRVHMKKACYESHVFDYRNYIVQMNEFIESL